jgi:hypothetical protein
MFVLIILSTIVIIFIILIIWLLWYTQPLQVPNRMVPNRMVPRIIPIVVGEEVQFEAERLPVIIVD